MSQAVQHEDGRSPEAVDSSCDRSPAMPVLRVIHGGDGTVVEGTERDDVDGVDALKACGFRWSRRQSFWFLPRTWGEPTRLLRVRRLQEMLGQERVAVEISEEPQRSAAEREQEARERAAGRAERLDARAERLEADAGSARQRRGRLQEAIPLGQPVLVGHHSQRRHERDLERIDREFDREVAAAEGSQRASEGAARARRRAVGAESVVTAGNRVERLEAELRGVRRRLEGTGRGADGLGGAAQGGYRERLLRMEARLVDNLEHARLRLQEAGGVQFSRDVVAPGDLVRVRGQWYPVVRSNLKSVSVPWTMGAIDNKATNTVPWHEVQAHVPAAEASVAQVRRMASSTSPAFSGLRARLEAHANRMVAEEQA